MSAVAMPDRDLQRLAKMAGLLTSDKAGEVVAAAEAATRLLRTHNLTWQALVLGNSTPAPSTLGSPAGWRKDLNLCLSTPAIFTRWELDFLRNLTKFRVPSAKQPDVLARLRDRAVGGR